MNLIDYYGWFANHKHISDSVIQSKIPDISTILEEIFAYIELK